MQLLKSDQIESKSKKIQRPFQLCLASRDFYPVYSGSALRFYRYLSGLRERNIYTRVFTGTPDISKQDHREVFLQWQMYEVGQMLPVDWVENTPVYRVKLHGHTPRRTALLFGQKLAAFSKSLALRPDLIQFVSLSLWTTPWLLELRRQKIPVVLAYTLLDRFADKGFKRKLQQYYWRLPFRLVDGVIVNSELMKRTLVKHGIRCRVEAIPNGVNTEQFRPPVTDAERTEIRQQVGVRPEAPLLITVGAVQPRKGTDLLLESWVQIATACPDAHLMIVGPRTDQLDPEHIAFNCKLESLVQQSGAANRIHWITYVDNVDAYLRAADVFVFTSKREGLPNAVLEAMATGLPVVLTPFAGMSQEIGRPGDHFVLVERNMWAIKEVICDLLNNKTRRLLLGEAARKWIETRMTLEATLDAYASFYRELAD